MNTNEYPTPGGVILRATIEKIAQDKLDLETLEVRNSDSLDFHELSITAIEEALRAAFIAGALQATCGMPHIHEIVTKVRAQIAKDIMEGAQ